MMIFIISLLLVLVAYHLTIGLIVFEALHNSSYNDFMQSIINNVYCITIVVLLAHIVYGTSAFFVITFFFVTLVTLLKVDYETSYNAINNLRNED